MEGAIMGIIKGVLKEELENSLRMKREYERVLESYPGGCFIQKSIKGHIYYYLAVRKGKKVKFAYKGKKLSQEDKLDLEKSRRLRKKYKGLIQKLNRQIKYLRKVLRGKEDV